MDLLPEKKKKSLDNYTRYSSIAFQMLIIILVGVFGGIKIDGWLHLGVPVFTIILSVLSVILAIYTVTKDLIKPGNGSERKSPDKK